MCGIVGYIGKREAMPIIIEGIKRLEYRGYDSSGVAVLNNEGELIVHKMKGKIVEMEKTIPNDKNFSSNCGISHTRWATHGEPSTINAHPHTDCSEKIAIVHNGIIENHDLLRKRLEEKGHKFSSQTDSEIIAHLIGDVHKTGKSLHESVRVTTKLLIGTYGLVVVSEDDPGVMIVARRGSPLIIGVGDGENFVASDAAALVTHTKRVIYLKDNETAKITAENIFIKDTFNGEIDKEIERIHWDISMIDKGDFEYYMLKEIFEQPQSIENSFRGRVESKFNTARLGGINISPKEMRDIKQICIVACGTSWHAGLVGEYIIEDLARIPVRVEYASEFRYRDPILKPDTLVITISQSGETADTLGALREAKARGAKVMGITNVIGSSIARETDFGSYIHAGAEIGVASTKAFTSQLTVLFLFALMMGRMRHLTPRQGADYLKDLEKIPSQVQEILNQNDKIKEIARKYKDATNTLYLGRGYNYPVALEGALKLKEISYIHAEGYPAAEMKHGPIALIDENMPVVFVATDDFIYEKILSNIEEVKSRKGKIIVIANSTTKGLTKLADDIIYIPRTSRPLTPLLTVIPMQLFAYHIAVLRGLDVDQPRNLAKSVTVE
ncbi:MAG: glutamine--fructose-6-phosphate transaminase (isomerizing) [Candidatus Cloacimonadota bacterium]|nr:glutamine--fructose-6-phosphate transaminase (isomerizing) [Candidatus Cloacimonadota bacterium]